MSNLNQIFEQAIYPKVVGVKPSAYPALEDVEPYLRGQEILLVARGKEYLSPKFATLVATPEGIHVFTKLEALFKKVGTSHEFFAFSTISGVRSFYKSVWKSCIEFTRAANVDTFGYLDSEVTEELVALVSSRAGQRAQDSGSTTQAEDPLAQIKKAKDLLDAGLITEQEFESIKAALISKI